MPEFLVPLPVYTVKIVCTLSHSTSALFFVISLNQWNAFHGATVGGHVDKGANSGNKENSGVSVSRE